MKEAVSKLVSYQGLSEFLLFESGKVRPEFLVAGLRVSSLMLQACAGTAYKA